MTDEKALEIDLAQYARAKTAARKAQNELIHLLETHVTDPVARTEYLRMARKNFQFFSPFNQRGKHPQEILTYAREKLAIKPEPGMTVEYADLVAQQPKGPGRSN